MFGCDRKEGNSLFVISFNAGSEAGLALISAVSERDAVQILRNSGRYNSKPDSYHIQKTRNLGMSASIRAELLLESYVNALVAYDAIVSAANKLQGLPGEDGKSAYKIALEHGFVGTEEEWLESLNGTSHLTPEIIASVLKYIPANQADITRIYSSLSGMDAILSSKANREELRWVEASAPAATRLRAAGQNAYGFGAISNAAWSEEGVGRSDTAVSYHYHSDIEFLGSRMRIFPTKNYIDGTEIYSLDYPIYPVARDVVEVNSKPFCVIVPNVEYEVGDPEYYDVYLSEMSGTPADLSHEPTSGWVVLIKDGALGPATHVEGIATTAKNEGQYAGGWYNDPSNSGSIHTIGCGTDDEHRANALDVHKSGKVYVKGVGSYNGTNASSSNDLATVINGINSVTFYAAWDGRNRPSVGRIPDCVTVEYQGQTYQGTLTPENANPGTFYLVRSSSEENDLYDEYVVTTYGFGKVWEKVGSRIDMSGYVSPYMIEVTKDDDEFTVDPEITKEDVEAAIQGGKLLYIDLVEDGKHFYLLSHTNATNDQVLITSIVGVLSSVAAITVLFTESGSSVFYFEGQTVTADEKTAWNGKQAALVSGENIKTINNESILGSGNIQIQGGGSDPDAVKYTEQSLTDAQKTQARTNIGAGTYDKPSGGIPSSDMASAVQTSLGKADTAYQKPANGIPASDIASGVIPTVPTDVVKYTSQSLTDAQKTQARTNIGAGTSDFSGAYADLSGKPTIPDELSDLTEDSTHRTVTDTEKATWNGKYTKPAGGIPSTDLASGVIPDAVSANPTVPSGTTPTALTGLKIGSNYYDVEAGGGTVTDVTVGGTSVVDANGVAVVPAIPTVPTISTDIDTDAASDAKTTSPKAVKTFVEGKGYGTYSKPSGGIPATDLAADAVPVIPVDTAIPSGGLDANTHYDLGTLTGSVSITLDATSAVSGMLNIYSLSFTAGSTAPTINWPSSITNWAGNCLDATTLAPIITGGNSYEVSIVSGMAVITEFVAS